MLPPFYTCEGRTFLSAASTKWNVDLMVGIAAAILDHAVTLGIETREEVWVLATMNEILFQF